MNKMRFIPLLALTALLTSCDLFGGGKMKAPTFSKEGEEVSYSEFRQKYQEAYENCEYADLESLLGDRIEKASTSSAETRTWKRGKTEVEKSEEQTTSKGEVQYDYDNLAAKGTSQIKSTQKSSAQDGSSSSTSNQESEVYYQFDKIQGTKYLIQANAKTMEYYGISSVSGRQTEESVFDNYVRNDMTTMGMMFSYRIPASESEAREYLFYVNNDVLFTFSQNTDKEENTTDYTVATKIKLKAQLDLTSKKEALRYSYEYKIEYTYKRNYSGYKEGDVVTTETKAYAEYTVNAKSVTVKPIDLSDYTLND